MVRRRGVADARAARALALLLALLVGAAAAPPPEGPAPKDVAARGMLLDKALTYKHVLEARARRGAALLRTSNPARMPR